MNKKIIICLLIIIITLFLTGCFKIKETEIGIVKSWEVNEKGNIFTITLEDGNKTIMNDWSDMPRTLYTGCLLVQDKERIGKAKYCRDDLK